MGQAFSGCIERKAPSLRRIIPYSLPKDKMPADFSKFYGEILRSGCGAPTFNQAPRRKLFAIKRKRLQSEGSLDELLSSALLAQDQDLAHIVRDVDEVLKTLKSDSPDTQAVSNTLQRAVLCVVKRSLLDRELRSLALTDDLTGLYNRRAFLALATQQLRVMRRRGQGLLLFFADVDNLKDINDSYGHREGDLALTRAADALERTFRDSDIMARLGGDEFGVLALEATCPSQEGMLHRLEQRLQESNGDESRYQLSLSAGVARFDPKHSASLGDLMAQADQAMYEEKRKHPRFWASRP